MGNTGNTGNTPQRGIVLARISDARDDDTRGVDGQVSDARKRAAGLGWKIGPKATHEIIENDTSAFKRRLVVLPDGRRELRTVRPGFRRALALLAAGQADGLIAVDLDRACRDPRDLEDLIDCVEANRVPVESVSGSLRLASDADITMARVMVAMANKSSRDTARRVADARRRRAVAGGNAGGRRSFGYAADGLGVVESEAKALREAAAGIVRGDSLRSVTAVLRSSGVPTVTGTAWTTSTLRDVLLKPRNAGLSVYRGEIVGEGNWEPILTEDEWRAVVAILTDPARRSSPGNAPKHLGSLIYLCGRCNDGTTVAVSGGRRAYVCRAHNHLRRMAAPVDALVRDVICARLERPDAVDLLEPEQNGDRAPNLPALKTELASLRELLDEQARLHARRVITTSQLEAGSAELAGRIRELEAELNSGPVPESSLAGIAGRPDAREVWDGLGIETQRAIVRELVRVTLKPGRPGRMPGGGYVDLSSVDIAWKR